MTEQTKKNTTYIHTLNNLNNNNNNNPLFYDDPKILRTYNVHYSLAESFKEFCDWLHLSASKGVECAMMEFMEDHRAEIPANVTFNLVAKPVLKVDQCGFKDCENPAVGSGIWKGKVTLKLCEAHLAEARGKPREWRVTSE